MEAALASRHSFVFARSIGNYLGFGLQRIYCGESHRLHVAFDRQELHQAVYTLMFQLAQFRSRFCTAGSF